MPVSPVRTLPGVALAALALVACDQPTATDKMPLARASVAAQNDDDKAVMGLFGEKVFNDKSLSLNKNQSCASCHDAAWGFSSPNTDVYANGAVMFGSATDRRNVPSADCTVRSSSFCAIASCCIRSISRSISTIAESVTLLRTSAEAMKCPA